MTLDEALESWARWVHRGKLISVHSVSSTGMVMELLRLGVTGAGHNGAARTLEACGCIEERIEAVMMTLVAAGGHKQRMALAVRAEYLMAVPDTKRQQEVRAIRLGVPLRSYKRQLANGRAYIAEALDWRG